MIKDLACECRLQTLGTHFDDEPITFHPCAVHDLVHVVSGCRLIDVIFRRSSRRPHRAAQEAAPRHPGLSLPGQPPARPGEAGQEHGRVRGLRLAGRHVLPGHPIRQPRGTTPHSPRSHWSPLSTVTLNWL